VIFNRLVEAAYYSNLTGIVDMVSGGQRTRLGVVCFGHGAIRTSVRSLTPHDSFLYAPNLIIETHRRAVLGKLSLAAQAEDSLWAEQCRYAHYTYL